MNIGYSFLVGVYIFLFSHLTKDKDFPQNVKTGAYVVMGIIGVVYVLTRVIF